MLTLTGKIHQTIAVIPVQCLMFVVGVGTGWLPPALTYLRESPDFKVNSVQSSWIGSLHYIGKIPGTFLAAFLMNKIGRKNVLVLVALISLLLWLVVLCAKSVPWICASRLIYGLTASMHETILPVYVAENCSPKMRGVFCAVTITFFSAGFTVAFVLSTFLSYNAQAIVNIVEVLIVLFITCLLRETPQFLLMKNRVTEAKECFFWLQGSAGPQTEARFKEIVEDVQKEREKFTWRVFFTSPENRKSLRVVLLLTTLIMATGYTGVNNFVHRSFADITTSAEAHHLTILYGLLQMISVMISSTMLDKFNRRSCLLLAVAISFCSHVVCALLQYVNSIGGGVRVSYYPWLILACNSLYASMWLAVLMPLFSIIRGELLPLNAKALGSSITLLSNASMSFIVAKEFLVVSERFGSHVNYVIYAVACVVLFVYVYYDLPETRGKSLVGIQQQLNRVEEKCPRNGEKPSCCSNC